MKSSVSGCASELVGVVLLLSAATACAAPGESSPLAPPLQQTASAPPDTPFPSLRAATEGNPQRHPSNVWDETPVVPQAQPPMAPEGTHESSELAPGCAGDRRGNWVCVWPAGQTSVGGPCVFGPDETIHVASETWSPDNRAVTAQLSQFDMTAHARWSRTWTRTGERASLTLSINALAFDSSGVLHAGGEICNLEAPGPLAVPGYYDSCVDARWLTLDARGNVLTEHTFGTSAGHERISDLGAAPDGGMYLVGGYHPPWLLGGERLGEEAARQNLYLARLDHAGDVLWWRSFGSAEHDGNALRLAVTRDGGVGVTGHLGLGPEGPGFMAHFDEHGTERWTYEDAGIYISRLASDGDDGFYLTPNRIHLDAAGTPHALPDRNASAAWRVIVTERDTLLSASQDGNRVVETDVEGRVLRELSFEGASNAWYRGGLCTGSDRVAISSTIEADSDFGILEQPLEIREPLAFLLVLNDW